MQPRISGSSARSSRLRGSASLDQADYDEVLRIAGEKRVSLSWVVRDAVREYIRREPPSPEPQHLSGEGQPHNRAQP